MKKLFLLSSLVALSLLAFTQVVPPKQVSDAFGSKFSGAENVTWSQESPKTWEAEFTIAGAEKSAIFSPAGEWMETESCVCMKDLPAEIFKTLALMFDGFKVKECSNVEKKDFTGYEIALEKCGTEVEIAASADGTFKLTSIEVRCGGMKCHEGMMEGQCKGMMEGGCKGMTMEECHKSMMEGGCKGMPEGGCKGMMEGGCKGMPEGGCRGMMEGGCKGMPEGGCKGMMEGGCKGMMESCCKGMAEGCCKAMMQECHKGMMEGTCKGESEKYGKEGKEGKEKGEDKDKD